MTRATRHVVNIAACLAIGSTAGATQIALAEEAQLSTVDFRVSCGEAGRPAFDRALAFMHHMMYVQARSSFGRIVETDPNCAMAHWGIATTLFQPLWSARPSAEYLQRGWREILKAKELEPASARERNLVAATEAFFRNPGAGGWWPRIERWADAMEIAYRASPDDLDTAALYALSRLALSPVRDERGPLHDEAEDVLRRVYEQVPTHPGAVHYTIHANDAAGRADRSLDIVRSYGEIAPEVPHALHMPSHIFVRLGEWGEVIDWNRRSADAALRYPVGDAVAFHYAHAADYLLYAHLQRGEDDLARAEDRPDEAVELIREAARLESTVEKHPVTPGALLPPYEALGELLLDLNRPKEALEAYRASEEVWPGRFNTLLGAARAAVAAGDEAAARDYYAQLLELAGGSERAAVSEAQAFLES